MRALAEQPRLSRRAVVAREAIGRVVFDMMHDPIQAHRRHDIPWVARGTLHTPRTCGRIAHDLQTHLSHRGWRRRRRWGGRSDWCEGCEVATFRLIIDKIISRNDVILSHYWRPDIETRHLSQCDEKRRVARRACARLLIAVIDAIS